MGFLAVLDMARRPDPPTDAQVATLGEQTTELLRLAAVSKAAHVRPMT